ncbi:PhzF family phenazine biosynthesis protein [Rhodovibrio salinarum]|uniref:PhzF family phenazine biosynthesis protein n=1 Tax=Rhodovibrio salinarum TaxID=1087 RepID=A0A934QI29_9PROT|nr:PhzF family phenazine biosynthesis protein [Rhodovibrio salinarum]MBK1697162.1 PhzF family phenazine biosynthesis protein [Rhodovibrio salinarum]
MTVPFYQVDAFAPARFQGNPAAVMVLETWLGDAHLQAIAAENNLAETAFLVPSEGHAADYELRWFTPTVEVDLCGHATLASGFVVLTHLVSGRDTVTFSSRSGLLSVRRTGDLYTLDFPVNPPEPANEHRAAMAVALGSRPETVLRAGGFWLAVFDHEAAVAGLVPDMAATAALGGVGVIASAPGEYVDIVSRFFAPQSGIDEDPVTGSAHTVLTPYWAERLDKGNLQARQISARGGTLSCRRNGDRVAIGGRCELVIAGHFHV